VGLTGRMPVPLLTHPLGIDDRQSSTIHGKS
jgi:hypothetical protein